MDKILWITTIKPVATNEGNPSGLSWEIIQYFRGIGNFVEIKIISNRDNIWVERLHRIGIFITKSKIDLDKYDYVFVYPNVVANYIPKKYWGKVISIGPDASSLLYDRIVKQMHGLHKIKFAIYKYIFMAYEKKWTDKLCALYVVGENDRQWLLRFRKDSVMKIRFLVHPLLLDSLVDDMNNNRRNIIFCKRFVFSGDLSKYYVGGFIRDIRNELFNEALNILVVGKRNEWIYKELSYLKKSSVEYIEWVEKYQDICNIGKDVHCVPLMAGAGTKNRVLTAIANGLDVVTTPIGIENIDISNVTEGIYLANDAKNFAEKMIFLNKHVISKIKIENRILERMAFRENIMKKFRGSLKWND